MKWGIWHRDTPLSKKPLATAEADTHEEAKKKLTPLGYGFFVKVEPVPEPGRSRVGRYFTQTGPVLSEEDLQRGS